ncbi:DUF3592 domain-containing protein [Lyngbya confervoides]|uniref:DUF3592 domain-containing protein n=1 Tax=Lyngbya confervoides BDU141951 TaxID=1574623 RepID=A0ABD4T034_9CYAN|nr:DUF3592 domain-containing protein [Lyngbya confervoides]MCM1981791.1 DUF3592 domain-containing protein [Lyngbya confervoides BDU141951]
MGFKSHPVNFEDQLSALIGLVIGLVFIGAGGWVQQRNLLEQTHWVEAQGTIVETVSRRERDGDSEETTYAPVIEFEVNGDPARFIGKYESYRLSRGNQMLIRYDPTQPEKTARVIEPLEGAVPWTILGLGGLVIVSSLWKVIPVRWSG